MKIETQFIYPPIPIRNHDWQATLESYEGGDPIGYGETEAEAIADLKTQLEEREDLRPPHFHFCPKHEQLWECSETECAPVTSDVTTDRECVRCEAAENASQLDANGYF